MRDVKAFAEEEINDGPGLEVKVAEVRVELRIDGRQVPLNQFVTKLVGNLLQAVLSSLHGVEEGWKVAELRVERLG